MVNISDNDVRRLAQFVKSNYGVNLDNKGTLIKTRLANALEGRITGTVEEYITSAIHDTTGKEISFLLTKLTTNYTYFMREEQHFKLMAQQILPGFEKKLTHRDLRTWSAGCSGGDEPYTIAMVIDDYFGARKTAWDTKILATDISQKALTEGVAGRYSADRLSQIPPAWKTRYFNKVSDDTYQVKDELKNEVIFRSFNLMEPRFAFKQRFHIIFCRNVMIYFEKDVKLALLSKFYDALDVGGYLIIGLSEPMGTFDSRFRAVIPSVYQKI